jgi:hypothetical protein
LTRLTASSFTRTGSPGLRIRLCNATIEQIRIRRCRHNEATTAKDAPKQQAKKT